MNPESDHAPFSAAALSPVFNAYLPEAHRGIFKLNKEKATIDGPWTPTMKIYGNSVELLSSILNFQQKTPGHTTLFGLDLVAPLDTIPQKYESLKKTDFIYRQDLLIKLQRLIENIDTPMPHFTNAMVGYFLKTKEFEMRNHVEMVPYPEEMLDDFGKQLMEKMKNIPSNLNLLSVSIDVVFEMLKKILPAHPRDNGYNSVKKYLNFLNTESSVQQNPAVYEKCLNWTKTVLTEFDAFIKEHPELFDPSHPRGTEAPRLRLFRDGYEGTKQFVLARELLEELKKANLDTKKVQAECDKIHVLGTIDFAPAMKLIGMDAKKFEFIKTPINRSDRRACPIPSFNGNYCIQTVDFIFETVREIITVHKYYHNITEILRWLLRDIYCAFQVYLMQKTNGARFIDIQDAVQLKSDLLRVISEVFSKFRPKQEQLFSYQVKEYREVGSRGFTLKDLKDELKRLGIMETYPGGRGVCLATERAEIIFAFMTMTKKHEELTTTDMIRAVEHVQFSMLLIDNAELYHIIHSHGACGRIPQICCFCNGFKMPPTPQTTRERFPIFFDYTINGQFQKGLFNYFKELLGADDLGILFQGFHISMTF